MGLPDLWGIIRDHEQVVPIAQLAEEHHKRFGRALRIAVDEADWRFNNLTQAQVYAIRDASNEPAFQGIEKAMFYRICRLLTLNIQLVFVFDGPGRPWKRGKRGGGKIDYEKRRLLQEMLRCFGIPYHEAPGEAEAECARLQILGMVDAVWSQDSDCLMFGCTLWIHDDRVAKEPGTTDRSKENTKKNGKYVRVVGARQMEASFSLDREGLVLFAMLVGGDYQTSGLPGCGVATAMHAIKANLGRSLCACRDQRDCSAWSIRLAEFLRTSPRAKNIYVPGNFPDFKTLQKYHSPKVSSDEVLRSNSRLNLGYDRPIEETRLLEVTSSRFNIWGRKYMDWIGPVLLTKHLSQRDSALPREVVHDIKLTKQRAKKTENQSATRCFERKLTFSPFSVTSLQRVDFEGARLGYWNGDMATSFDPGHRVECEIPDYWLQKVLPLDVLDPSLIEPKPHPQKRKQKEDDDVPDTEKTATRKRGRKTKKNGEVTSQSRPGASSNKPVQRAHSQALATPVKTPKQLATIGEKVLVELSESEDEDALRLPSKPPRSRNVDSTRSILSGIIDFGSPEPSEDDEQLSGQNEPNIDSPSHLPLLEQDLMLTVGEREERDLQEALKLSLQEQPAAASPSLPQHMLDVFYAQECSFGVSKSSVPFKRAVLSGSPDIHASNQSTTHHSYNAISHLLDSSANCSGHKVRPGPPVESLGQPSFSPVPTPFSTVPTSTRREANTTASTFEASENLPSSSTRLADVRAARLRHFAAVPPTTTINRKATSTLSPQQTPSKLTKPCFCVPIGVDCIDLTDD